MAFERRDLEIRIIGDGDSAEKMMKNLSGGAGNATTSFGKLTAAVAVGNAIFAVATKAVGGMVNFLGDSVKSAQDSENAMAQLNSVLKSTGNAAGLSALQLNEQAAALQKMTRFNDEAISSAQSLLLTFTNIKGKVFKDSIPLILDMSQAMGQDLKSSAIQLGKALNDPVKGITALTRVGVAFTEQQKTQIETLTAAGKSAQAQEIILAELRKEFGGSALAAGQTFAGSLERLKNQFDDVKERIGGVILEALNPLATKLANFVATDQFASWVESVTLGLEKMINFFGSFIAMAVQVFNAFQEKYQQVKKWIDANPFMQQLFETLQPLLKDISDTLTQRLLPKFQEWFRLFGPEIRRSIELFGMVLAAAFVGTLVIVDGLLNALDKLMGMLNNMKRNIDAIFSTTSSLGDRFKGLGNLALPGNPFKLEKRAMGGPVTANQPYITSERGPELFIPGQSGQIINNDQLRRMIGAQSAPSQVVSSPKFEINISAGAFMGTPNELRDLSEKIWREITRSAKAQGVMLPQIGVQIQ